MNWGKVLVWLGIGCFLVVVWTVVISLLLVSVGSM